MAVTAYNMRKQIEETIKISEKAAFEARRAHERIDALPKPEPIPAPLKGERGTTGPAGRDGRDGAPGRDAVGIQGPQGRPGKDCVCATEQRIVDAVRKLDAATADLAAVKAQIADIKFIVNALFDANKKGQKYISWLRKTAAVLRSKQ